MVLLPVLVIAVAVAAALIVPHVKALTRGGHRTGTCLPTLQMNILGGGTPYLAHTDSAR
jgi:hypothetical protein